MSVITTAVNTSRDDGDVIGNTSMVERATANMAGRKTSLYSTWLRFGGFSLTGTVSNAYITLWVVNSEGTPTLDIKLQDAPSPVSPFTIAEFFGAPRASTIVAWDGTHIVGSASSPNLAPVLNELLGKYGTLSSIVCYLEGDRCVDGSLLTMGAYDGGRAASITIEYDTTLPPPGVPGKVMGLAVNSVSQRSMELRWNHNPSADNVSEYVVHVRG